jgi:glycine dehydrogenase
MSQNPASGTTNSTLYHLEDHSEFIMRHIGPRDEQVQRMLAEIGLESLDELVAQTIPRSIRIDDPLDLHEARS